MLKLTGLDRDGGGVKGESYGCWLGSGIENTGGNRLVNKNRKNRIEMGMYLGVELLDLMVILCLV